MYTYYQLLDDINSLSHSGLETGAIGQSVEGRMIPYAFTGRKTGPQVIVTGGIHAREHISSYLTVCQLFHLVKNKDKLCGGIYFVPMVNPDGNLIAACGLKTLSPQRRNFVEGLCGKDCALYKANAAGVDLNVNFEARWGTGKSNVFMPDSANFVGYSPFSEPETKALRDFTLFVKPDCTLSYHCIGRELYWDFFQDGKRRERDEKLAQFVNTYLNYKIIKNDGSSAGGYKDWCIESLKIPSLTIELVSENHRHPFVDYSCASSDIERNLPLLEGLLKYLQN